MILSDEVCSIALMSGKEYKKVFFLVPSAPPSNVTVQEKTSTSSLSIQWMDVPDNETNGHLIGYTVIYRAVKVGGKEVVDDVVKESVGTGTHSITLNDLQSFTTYEIRVAGITRRGEGVFSQPIEGGLCKECVYIVSTHG